MIHIHSARFAGLSGHDEKTRRLSLVLPNIKIFAAKSASALEERIIVASPAVRKRIEAE
jgi:hypothetical protein